MQANDNDFQRFERLKREIEWNVDQGFSYKAAFAELDRTRRSSALRKQSSVDSEPPSPAPEEDQPADLELSRQ